MADTADTINHVAPRDVQPDSQSTTGAKTTPRDKSSTEHTSGPTLRPDPVVEETGADRAGVAGGSIDSKV